MSSLVPHRFRNMICPHQTEREIRKQARDAQRLYDRLPKGERKAFSREDEPDREWPAGGAVVADEEAALLRLAADPTPGIASFLGISFARAGEPLP